MPIVSARRYSEPANGVIAARTGRGHARTGPASRGWDQHVRLARLVTGAAMPRPKSPLPLARIAAETALLAAIGLFLAVLGPFGTIERPWLVRLAYWPAVIVGGGVIGIAIDVAAQRWLAALWPRLFV